VAGTRPLVALRECEEHGWIRDRADPQARDRALAAAHQDPPTSLSPDEADADVRYVLNSIGDTCPAPVQPLTIGSEFYLTRNSS
jgi:hypothetical protein